MQKEAENRQRKGEGDVEGTCWHAESLEAMGREDEEARYST